MAIQAQLYDSDNFGFAFAAGPPPHHHQDLLMESGCNNNYGFDQQQQFMMQFDQFHNSSSSHHKNLNFLLENNNNNHFILPKNNMNDHHQKQYVDFSHSVTAHIEKQRMEFEQFINLQNERLRIAIQEQRKQQISLLLKKYESQTEFLLAQKEEETGKAGNRTMELQDILKRMEFENKTWQKIAKEKESMVVSLNSTIQRLRESASLSANPADDAESCCQNGEEADQNATTAILPMGGICKCCNSRNSCVVLLPCRHLCSCKDCEVFLPTCPVCTMVKKGSIEALI